MNSIALRPTRPDQDFVQIAALFSQEQDETTSETALREDYATHKERIFRLMVAEGEQGTAGGQPQLLGFNWATRSRFDATQAYIYVIVKPEYRGQGVGSRLYADVEQAAKVAGIKQMHISLRDSCDGCRAFAVQCGFTEQAHYVGLALDLDTFDDRRFNETIARLQWEGFQFTSMEALGNTPEAQRKLYRLNDTTLMEEVVPADSHSWLSFADFQKRVCQADWYLPGGQLVAIDTARGTWAAMSAITRYAGADHAYHLHTGVDRRYHGRGLAQVMLVHALRYAREALHVSRIQTEENAASLSSLAIYRELGYTQVPGIFSMMKELGAR
jgi:GNAT superfamily N-acetyltransferase